VLTHQAFGDEQNEGLVMATGAASSFSLSIPPPTLCTVKKNENYLSRHTTNEEESSIIYTLEKG
jgi:hypothetical protein